MTVRGRRFGPFLRTDTYRNGKLPIQLPKGELEDDLLCQCNFYRGYQYQLPCQHIWQFHLMNGVITPNDWTRWASIFGDSGFEIYETTTKTYAIKEIHSVIGGPAKHMLKIREVLDDIKTRVFELDKLTLGFTPEQKDRYLMLWVQNLKKMTRQIRKTAAKDALKQLQEEGLVLIGEVAEEVQAWD